MQYAGTGNPAQSAKHQPRISTSLTNFTPG
jgi:hypothetical protein